ncbi:hypothetical protein RYZ26_02295 [Terasakiella sp. A23]|uniref:hypothetical protein n=1 Tax=Terasakiella sp. FCG-A23 TaxID=3080561 RepID=UPI002953C3CA|nr:hypothetical protein [Terasakiella sp. A23]MDV7338410.1 hypothetical protein [Terasakiella sp. A23]
MNERQRYEFFLEKTKDIPRNSNEGLDQIVYFAEKLQIPEIGKVGINWASVNSTIRNLERAEKRLAAHFEVVEFMESGSLTVDGPWRDRLFTYVEHIKTTVRNNIPDSPKKEAILKKIQLLEEELNTEKIKLERIGDLWLTVTSYVGEGAKNLLPVGTLLGKMNNALSKADEEAEEQKKMLPPPDDVGLDEIDDEAAE